MGKILNIAGLTFSLLVMVAVVALHIAPHFGWEVACIRSGSMSPVLQRGDMVILCPVDSRDIAVNDIIAFNPVTVGEENICHRVVAIKQNGSLEFQTKGDAEPIQDPFQVPPDKVIGRVVYAAPNLGYLIIFLRTIPGFLLSILMPGLFIMLICLSGIKAELRKNRGRNLK